MEISMAIIHKCLVCIIIVAVCLLAQRFDRYIGLDDQEKNTDTIEQLID